MVEETVEKMVYNLAAGMAATMEFVKALNWVVAMDSCMVENLVVKLDLL